MLAALRVTAGATPVPDKTAVCGPPGRLLETVKAPLRGPVVEGAKATLTVQLEATVREAQLFVCVKSPLTPIVMVAVLPPLFFNVIGCVGLLVPTNWLPKLKFLGETFSGGGV